MDRLPCNASRFDRHAEVEPEFEQKLIEHILLGSTLDEMLRVLQEAVLYVIWIGLPRADVRGSKLEDTKARITLEEWIFFIDPLCRTTEALFSQFRYFARQLQFITKVGRHFLFPVAWVERLGELHQHIASLNAFRGILLQHRMSCCPGPRKEV